MFFSQELAAEIEAVKGPPKVKTPLTDSSFDKTPVPPTPPKTPGQQGMLYNTMNWNVFKMFSLHFNF